ncbi:MAG TPA: manganese efflux pump [Streptosporangiaceae bacterium]|nr:manganese efflux pump [Streptosporangiaceae bacterium]
MLALTLVAFSVGFGNLAASIGIGVGGVDAATRVRVLLTFGLFEAGMPIVGLIIGHDLASDIGRDARWIGSLLLVGVGIYGIAGFVRNHGPGSIGLRRRGREDVARQPDAQALDVPAADGDLATEPAVISVGTREQAKGRQGNPAARRQELIKIGISGFALSLDNLIAGFALGGYQVNLVTGALVFGLVSIGMSLAGLEFGSRLTGWAGDSGELLGGIVLIGVGAAIGLGVLG